MEPYHFSQELNRTRSRAMRLLPYLPRRSKYRSYTYQLIAEELEATKYHALKKRLHQLELEISNRSHDRSVRLWPAA